MYLGNRSLIVIAFMFVACLGPGARLGTAQQIRVDGIFPRQLPRGQTTAINVAVPSHDAIRAAEISPPAGVKISGIKKGEDFQGPYTWSELSVDVAPDAAPGDRMLVLVLPMGRTAPITMPIPSHVPKISDFRIVSAQSNQPTLEFQFAAAHPSAHFGDSPYVWFMFGCGDEPIPGVVSGKWAGQDKRNGIIRTMVPNPRPPAGSKCDVQVRVTDSGGIESNTLKVTVDLKN